MTLHSKSSQAGITLATLFGVFVAGMVILRQSLQPPADEWMYSTPNNPDKFYIWGTTTNFNHSFTYDPHAADGWLFEWGNPPATDIPPDFARRR